MRLFIGSAGTTQSKDIEKRDVVWAVAEWVREEYSAHYWEDAGWFTFSVEHADGSSSHFMMHTTEVDICRFRFNSRRTNLAMAIPDFIGVYGLTLAFDLFDPELFEKLRVGLDKWLKS